MCIFVYDSDHYAALCAQLTAGFLKRQLGALLTGEITRYELPELRGLNFVMQNALEGGVNGSLNLDAHGKSWSFLLLGLTVELD